MGQRENITFLDKQSVNSLLVLLFSWNLFIIRKNMHSAGFILSRVVFESCLLTLHAVCGFVCGVCALQFIPLPPEGSVATSLLTGKPAPSPLFSTGPSDGFSCHVNPSKLIAVAQREGERREAV